MQASRVGYGMTKMCNLVQKVVVRRGVGDEAFLMAAMHVLLRLALCQPLVLQWLQRRAAWNSWHDDYKRLH